MKKSWQNGNAGVGNIEGLENRILFMLMMDFPTAYSDLFYVPANSVCTFNSSHGICQNDVNTKYASGDLKKVIHGKITLVDQPRHGVLDMKKDGSFVYVPDYGFTGTDKFTYTLTGDHRKSPTASATLIVDSDTIAVRDEYQRPISGSLTVNAENGLLANDINFGGGSPGVSLISGPSHGQVSLNSDGSFTYVPDPPPGNEEQAGIFYVYSDSFTYQINGDGENSIAEVLLDGWIIEDSYFADPVVTSGFSPDKIVTLIKPHVGRMVKPNNRDLVVFGDQGDDVIKLDEKGGKVSVKLNGKNLGLFSAAAGIVVEGFDGDDVIDASGVKRPVRIYGGQGNDTIVGSRTATNKLFGGAGIDLLKGPAKTTSFVGGKKDVIIQCDSESQFYGVMGFGLQ